MPDGGSGLRAGLDCRGSARAVTLVLAAGPASPGDAKGGRFAAFGPIAGTAGGDTLSGQGARRCAAGDTGAEPRQGGAGADFTTGGTGADVPEGGGGVYAMDFHNAVITTFASVRPAG